MVKLQCLAERFCRGLQRPLRLPEWSLWAALRRARTAKVGEQRQLTLRRVQELRQLPLLPLRARIKLALCCRPWLRVS